jgi:hypothetical protein
MSLNEDFELVFSSGSESRLFLDVSEFTSLFPDASEMEIYELIHMYSTEMAELLDIGPGDEVPLDVQEYVKAAVACALTRLYNLSGLGGTAGMDVSFQLGDLQVSRRSSTGTNGRGSVTRATAQGWCELAAVLREELLRTRTGAGMRAIVRGSNHVNPMPSRHIRHKEDAPMTVWE